MMSAARTVQPARQCAAGFGYQVPHDTKVGTLVFNEELVATDVDLSTGSTEGNILNTDSTRHVQTPLINEIRCPLTTENVCPAKRGTDIRQVRRLSANPRIQVRGK